MVPFALLTVTIISVPLLIFDDKSLPRLQQLKAELARAEKSSEQLRREVEAARRRVKKLREDPAAIEKIARDELGMVRKDELIFQFPQ